MDAMDSSEIEAAEPIASGRFPKKLTPPALERRHIGLANRLSVRRRPFAFNVSDAVVSFQPRGLGSIPSSSDGDVADLISIGLRMDGQPATICLSRSLFERIIERSDPDLLVVDPSDDVFPLLLEALASEALSAAEANYLGRIELLHIEHGMASLSLGLDLLFEIGLDGDVAGMASLRTNDVGADRLAKVFAKAPKVRSIDHDLKAELSVRAGTLWLTTGELQSLRPGDVLIADDSGSETEELAATLGEAWLLNAELSQAGLTLTKPLRPATPKDRELWMMDDTKQSTDGDDELAEAFEKGRGDGAPDKTRRRDERAEARAERPPSDDMPSDNKPEDARFDDVPIKLVFEVGRVEINLGRLQEIGPGHVFELDRPVGEAVEVFAGGRRIGQGEIVGIGEQAGVRMVRLFGHD